MANKKLTKNEASLRRAYKITFATLVVVLFMYLIALFAYGVVNPNYNKEHDPLISLDSGWTVTDEYNRVVESDVTLPFKSGLDGHFATFTRELDSESAGISSVIFNSKREAIKVSLDGEELYSVNCTPLYDYLSTTGPNIVRLNPKEGSKLSFTITIPADGICTLESVSGGSIDRVNYCIYRYDIVTIINIIVLLLFSLILLITSLYMLYKHTFDKTIFIMTVFDLMIAAWAYSDSALHCLSPISSEAAALLAYALAPFIPVAIVVYTMLMCRGTYSSLRIILLSDCGLTLMRILLALGGLAKLNTTAWFAMVFILISLMICLNCTRREYAVSQSKFSLALFLGFVLGAGTMIITTVAYALGLGSLYRSVGLTVVSCLFIYIAVMAVFSNATAEVNMQRDLDRMEFLENEAMTDSLTGLRNRASFDQFLGEIAKSPENYASTVLVMLDLNGLKSVNDTHGHAAGDELIISAARCISETIGKDAYCFRIGGDEFTVILHNYIGSVKMRLARMHEWMDEYNETAKYKLSIAHGESTLRYHDGNLRTLSDWKQDADINMYNNKNLNSLRRANMRSEYQNILRYIINNAANLDSCREDIEHGLGTFYDPEIGRIVLNNWDALTKILLNGSSEQE